jgi:S-DNA-T family DNA segregation ATPase FtsK/SpoIIIE
LLGVLGAFISYFFIDNGFGVASLLICTFFFVVGVNLLFRRKVWSVWKNLRYVTIGMLVLSVCMAFTLGFSGSQFPFGGAVGNMISDWLKKILGNVGTAALLLVVAVSYVIWQFNPAFNVPKMPKRRIVDEEQPETNMPEEKVVPVLGKTINDIYAENGSKGNSLKSNGDTLVLSPSLTNNDQPGFQLIERDEPDVEIVKEKPLPITPFEEPIQTILHKEEIKPVRKTAKQNSEADIALEIKEFPKEPVEEQEEGKEKEKGIRRTSAL